MYAREGEGLEVSLQRLFLQGLFLRRRAPDRLLNMSSERRRELLRQHHKWFCERQKNCFWHSSRLKTKGERRLAVVFISLFRGYAAILAPHRKRVACGEGELSVEVEVYRYSEVNHLWNTGLMRWMLLSASCSTISLSMRDVLMRVILDLLPSGNNS